MKFSRFASLLTASLLAGCSTVNSLLPGQSNILLADIVGGQVSRPAAMTGLAVSDEPFAAKAGTAVMAQGGSAADAAAAMFFALSVTYPVAGGLGGGGICLVRSNQGRIAEFDFLARAAGRGGPYAVPGAVAGFYDLQKAYGALPWQRVVAPAEVYAGAGFPISHVLAQRLAVAQSVIAQDAVLAGEFMSNGALKPEGALVSNPALASTLAAVRLSGADGFYKGAVAAGLAAASAAGPISLAELAAYRATLVQPRTLRRGQVSAAVPGPSTGAGAFIAALLTNTGNGEAQTAVVNGLRRTLASFNIASVPPDLGATGFAAMDKNGQAVACAVSLNGPFGSGHSDASSGVQLAASPTAPGGIAGAFLTPMIVTDSSGQVTLAGAGTGGPNGSGAMMYALLRRAGGASVTRAADLRSTGLAPFATVNTIACQNGLCVALPDPGGNGLGASVDQPVAAK